MFKFIEYLLGKQSNVACDLYTCNNPYQAKSKQNKIIEQHAYDGKFGEDCN